MPRRNFLFPFLGLLAAALFAMLLVRLLLLRYERGDIYPEYSTLRADPLGARAYYEALGSVSGYAPERGFVPLHRALATKPETLFYLGLGPYELSSLSEDEVTALDDFVKNGGRIVLTFSPDGPESETFEPVAKKKAEQKNSPPPAKTDKAAPALPNPPAADDGSAPKTRQEKYERDLWKQEQADNKDEPTAKYQPSLAALWGFGEDVTRGEKTKRGPDPSDTSSSDDEKPQVMAQRISGAGLEADVPWDSALYFVRLEPEWQELYAAKSQPVMIRRSWGRGEIIVATDSYLISNEALRNDRRPALLAFLAGAGGRMLFDETHLGTEEQDGVMVLMRRLHLEGYLCGTLGVVLLLVWRNSSPLVPPHATGGGALLGGAVSGKDSRSGLVNLLRRNIPAGDILKTSFAEWARGVTPGRLHLRARMTEMQGVLAAASGTKLEQILETYHRLREINQPGGKKEHYGTKSETAR